MKTILSFFKKLIYAEGVNALPAKMIIPLFFLMLFNGMTNFMSFSFMPKLVKMFGYSEVSTGSRVGLLGASLYLGNVISSLTWGIMADTFGRKRTMLIAGVLTSSTWLSFGFSFNYWWAFITRFLLGLSGGLSVISVAILVSETDDTNRNLGMSILFATFSLGHILGPSTGGFLAFPHSRYPDVFKEDSIFTKFPILLPTAIGSCGMGLMLVVFWRFVPSDKKKERPADYRQIRYNLTEAKLTEKSLLLSAQIENQCNGQTAKSSSSFELFKKIARNKVCVMSCILYGGFGFSPTDIGLLLMVTAATTIIFQFTVSSKMLDLLGPKKFFIICNVIQTVLYPLVPLCHIIQSNRYGFWAALTAVTFTMQICDSNSYVSAALLVSTSVEKSLLASANGLCMMAGIFGRLIGVPIAGVVYSWSLTNERNLSGKEEVLDFPFNHYFIFFILSIGTVLNITLAYFLPENLDRKKAAAKNRVSRQSQLLDVDL